MYKRQGSAQGGAPEATGAAGEITCPYTGVLLAWKVEDGAEVKEGQTVAIVEAMKMESPITAKSAGTVSLSNINEGDSVSQGDVIATLK